MAQTDFLIFPTLQGPVLTQSQEAEAVTESRWHQPLSEPVRVGIDPRLAVALATSSGQAPISSWALLHAESVTLDRWLIPLSEPKRFPPRLDESLQRFYTVSAMDVTYAANTETGSRAPFYIAATATGKLASIWKGSAT